MSKKIEVIKTDITELEVDAIVNASNSSLLRGGGVCGAIFNKAGFELDKECNKIGHCDVGEAVITKGYNLKAKNIIHTVAPQWLDFRLKNKEELLRNCYKNSLKIAIENNIKSIAFPCIGTGIYKCPIELGKRLAFEEANKVIDYFEKIYFVCFTDKEYKIYKEEYLPRLESLITEKDQNNFVSLKMDNYTNFYFKIERKTDFIHNTYDKWCDVTISIFNKNFNYKNDGELLLEYEVIELRKFFKKFINSELKKGESISFVEPDLEFKLYTNNLVDLRVSLFEDGALSPNYYNLRFDKKKKKKIYEHIIKVFPEEKDNRIEEVEEKTYEMPNDPQNQYYYITVKYDKYNNGKKYCYISEDTTIKTGDKVVVYMANSIVIASVIDTQYCTRKNAPYPVEKTKRIIEKVTENTDLSKYDLYYDDFEEYDEDDYISAKELAKKEREINKLHKIILAVKEDKLSIKRLMKFLTLKNKQELCITMYYSKKLNLFINKVATDFYMLPEYDANLFNKSEYKKLIQGAIIVPRKLYKDKENTEKIYQDAINFCTENNIEYIDDLKK